MAHRQLETRYSNFGRRQTIRCDRVKFTGVNHEQTKMWLKINEEIEIGILLVLSTDHEMRKGSGKLLWTLMMRLSLVTEKIFGPGNWPLISIPCSKFEPSCLNY